jgi:hypothetical protein
MYLFMGSGVECKAFFTSGYIKKEGGQSKKVNTSCFSIYSFTNLQKTIIGIKATKTSIKPKF